MKFVKSAIMVVAGDSILSESRKVKFYRKLENSLFINKLLGQSRNDYSSLIKHARVLFNADDNNRNEAFNQLLNSLDSKEIVCDDESIKRAILEFGNYIKRKSGYYDWDGIRYFLYEYDISLNFTDAKVVNWRHIDNNSIEHILPQTPENDYWQIVLEPISDKKDEIRKVTNNIGNLLLLSQGENSELQNYSFPTKKERTVSANKFAYKFGSRSAQEVAEEDFWTLNRIYKRQIKFVNFMFDRWISKNTTNLCKDEFLRLFKEYGLLIDEFDELSEEKLQNLNTIDFSAERNASHSETKEPTDLLKELKSCFNLSGFYKMIINDKNVAYKNQRFTFVENENILRCGTKIDGIDYEIKYGDLNVLDITYANDKTRKVVDLENLHNDLRFFVRVFNRCLRLTGKTNAELKSNCI